MKKEVTETLRIWDDDSLLGLNFRRSSDQLRKWKFEMAAKSTTVTRLILRRGIASMKDLDRAQALITKAGLFSDGSLIAAVISWASISPEGCLARASSIFSETAMDEPLVCNAMLRAYAVSVFPLTALGLFNGMQRSGIRSDGFTFSFALRACVKVLRSSQTEEKDCSEIEKKGFEIHSRALKLGFRCDGFVEASLLLFYAKCGFVELARQVFDEMPKRRKETSSWNVMISAYDRIGDFESADSLFRSMPEKSVVSYNIKLSRLVGLGKIKEAEKLFDEMPERDSVSWNTLISCHVKSKHHSKALHVFLEMESAGAKPTEITLISVLNACSETNSLRIGKRIHDSLLSEKTKIEGYLGNALVDMYAKCGDLSSAKKVFDFTKIKPTSLYNAMISGFAIHGRSKEALDLFSEMESSDDVSPNRVTFIAVLTACSRKGLVFEGRAIFDRMINDHEIEPDEKLLGCMVDLLTRFGFLEEAFRTIEARAGPASVMMWRTLLGACAVHGNVGVAEDCFRKLAEVADPTDGDYVLMSNVFAGVGRWDGVYRIRNEMIRAGVRKVLACTHSSDS